MFTGLYTEVTDVIKPPVIMRKAKPIGWVTLFLFFLRDCCVCVVRVVCVVYVFYSLRLEFIFIFVPHVHHSIIMSKAYSIILSSWVKHIPSKPIGWVWTLQGVFHCNWSIRLHKGSYLYCYSLAIFIGVHLYYLFIFLDVLSFNQVIINHLIFSTVIYWRERTPLKAKYIASKRLQQCWIKRKNMPVIYWPFALENYPWRMRPVYVWSLWICLIGLLRAARDISMWMRMSRIRWDAVFIFIF